jgi:hypothetical protein
MSAKSTTQLAVQYFIIGMGLMAYSSTPSLGAETFALSHVDTPLKYTRAAERNYTPIRPQERGHISNFNGIASPSCGVRRASHRPTGQGFWSDPKRQATIVDHAQIQCALSTAAGPGPISTHLSVSHMSLRSRI